MARASSLVRKTASLVDKTASKEEELGPGYLTAFGYLYHGIFDEWLKRMRIPGRYETSAGVHRRWDELAPPHDSFKLEYDEGYMPFLESKISATLLRRIPSSERENPGTLLLCLPKYCAPFRLMDLPAEIRTMVYSHLDLQFHVENPTSRDKNRSNHWGQPIPLRPGDPFPQIAHTASTIRREVLPEIFERMRITVNARNGLQGFRANLSLHPPNVLQCISGVEVEGISRSDPYEIRNLAFYTHRCKPLEVVIFDLDWKFILSAKFPNFGSLLRDSIKESLQRRGLAGATTHHCGLALLDFLCIDLIECVQKHDAFWSDIHDFGEEDCFLLDPTLPWGDSSEEAD